MEGAGGGRGAGCRGGAVAAGSVEPKMETVGRPRAATWCMVPVSWVLRWATSQQGYALK